MNATWVMDEWVELWDEDAGVIPSGAEKKEFRSGKIVEGLDVIWFYRGHEMTFDSQHGWTFAALEELYAAQLGAVISRLSRIDGFTLKILNGIVVVGIFPHGKVFKAVACAGYSTALLGNLAAMMRWVLEHLSEQHGNATDGAAKLKIGFGLLT